MSPIDTIKQYAVAAVSLSQATARSELEISVAKELKTHIKHFKPSSRLLSRINSHRRKSHSPPHRNHPRSST